METLFVLQNKFQEYLLKSDNAIASDVISTEKVSADSRLSIYYNAYRNRLMGALATNYPVMQIYLGQEQFEALAFSYIDFYPSNFPSIRWFGNKLEIFLKENSPYNNFPYLSELAKVEWIMTLVFDSTDSKMVTLKTLKKISPDAWIKMRFVVNPSVHLIQLTSNIVLIWQAILQDKSPPNLIQNENLTDWIFWRNNFNPYYTSLTYKETLVIKAMLNENSFGKICEILCEEMNEENIALYLASLLNGWMAAGLIAAINY